MTERVKVWVACKLPHGIILELPKSDNPDDGIETVTLNGLNKVRIVGATYGITKVDQQFWERWIKANPKYPAVQSGAIFMHKSEDSVEAIAEEYKERKTGFERIDPKDKKNGVKTLDTEDA